MENIDFQNLLVSDLSFLSGMTRVEYLNLSSIPAGTDLSPLKNLSSVKSLNIQSPEAPIGTCPSSPA